MASSTLPAAVMRAYPGATDAKIVEVFHRDERGWRTLRGWPVDLDRLVAGTYRKTLTPTYARKLRAAGVTGVAVEVAPGRCADFTIAELTRRS